MKLNEFTPQKTVCESQDTNCVYCGFRAECREHVIPVSFFGRARTYDKNEEWIVPACSSCNTLAGCAVFFSIPQKAEFILKKFKQKYKKILNMPEWTTDELSELDYTLKEMVWGKLVAKRVASEKVEFLESVSELPFDYGMTKFIKQRYTEWQKRLLEEEDWKKKLKKSLRKKRKPSNKT